MRKKTDPARVKRRKKIAVWSFALIMLASLVAPFGGFVITALDSSAVAQEKPADSNPRSNYWRAVKGGVDGVSTVQGAETGVLINQGGTDWTNFRQGPVFKNLPWIVLGMLVLVTLYHLIHGKNKLEKRPSGILVKRWSGFERLVHWVTAVSFICLAITGLSMLLGRTVLLPLLSGIEGGKAAFAAWSQFAIQLHNIMGPVLSVGIVLMIVMWIWFNFPGKGDWGWIKAGGGLVGNKHPSAGRMNFGEKVWFWVICTFGLVVVVSGVVLVLPSFPSMAEYVPMTFDRNNMAEANQFHIIAGLIWMAIAIGHIYIGTAGTEGALQGMSTGYVTAEWAEQHHNLWFDKLQRQGKVPRQPDRYARGHNAVRQRSL